MASKITAYIRCYRASLLVTAFSISLCQLFEPESCCADEPTREAEDTAIHVPTPIDVVARMLVEARVNQDDVLYDLGCGDGRIVVEASKTYGCRAVGYDISVRKVAQSKENIDKHGLASLARAELRDIFEVDLSGASVITLYLLPELNEQLIPQLEKLKKGSRIVAHEFPIEGIQHDRIVNLKSEGDNVPRKIYLYSAPLKRIVSSR
jgi:precorrin-6B methylase 2